MEELARKYERQHYGHITEVTPYGFWFKDPNLKSEYFVNYTYLMNIKGAN